MKEVSKGLRPPIHGLKIELREVERKGIRAAKLDFHYRANPRYSRSYLEIKNMIGSMGLSQKARDNALLIFKIIAEAESRIHGKEIGQIHFHEIGSEDSILDIISAVYIYDLVGNPVIVSTPVALASRGEMNFSHGKVSLPAPAVMEILKGVTVCFTRETQELTTPTGAAIIRALDFRIDQKLPERAVVLQTGYGAGYRDLDQRANIVRVCLLSG